MKKILLLLALFATPLFGEEVPQPAAKREPPPGLEGLVWNKWDTPNFIVISLDKGQGSSMRSEAEAVRSSLLERWSLADSKRECKLVCVPDAIMLKRLFGLTEPRCEVFRAESGEVRAAIWIDIARKDLLPSLVAEAELSNDGFRSFAQRGVPILERPASEVREKLGAMGDPPLATVLEGIKPGSDAQDLDRNSAMLCLMVRKELGGGAFAAAAVSSPHQVHEELGFGSLEEMDKTFRRYRAYLISDLRVIGRVPDGYLGVRP